jgi:hypothetical protein
MPDGDLHVAALAVAGAARPDYLPVSTLEPDDDYRLLAQSMSALTGTPADCLTIRADDGAKDIGVRALRALGAPARTEPLYLVRSGPVPDSYVAVLAWLVQELGWPGEDTGITHLDEAGGTVVFDLLDWSTPAAGRATALIMDEPLFTDARTGPAPASAVAVRVRRGGGALRVLGWGEGEPAAAGAGHEFAGTGPCAGWLEMHAAVQAGRLQARERVLIRAAGGSRAGWVLLEVTDAGQLCRQGAAVAPPSGEAGR